MRWLATMAFYVKSLFSKRKLETQMSEEICTHVEMATEANVAAGMSPEDARNAALREFGIRIALGASAHEVLAHVLHEGAILIVLGLALGLAGSVAAVHLMEKMIFEISLYDPVIFLAVPLLLAAVAGFACWLPARRAAKVDPVIALRAE